MKRIIVIALLMGIVLNSFSQVSEFTLKNPDKSKTLSADADITFYIDISGDSLDQGYIEYSGVIEDISEDGLILTPAEYNKSGSGDGFYFDYSETYYDGTGDQVTIDPRTLSSIHYQSNGASTVSAISGVIAALGYTTALVVAPLISINYKTGDFNAPRYYKVAGYSLITVGVTLPISILSSGKSFEFKDLFENDEYDEGWEFDYDQVGRW